MFSRALHAHPTALMDGDGAERFAKDSVVLKRAGSRVSRDREWLKAAYRAHATAVKVRATAIMPDRDLADDLTQETFVTAWRGRHHFAVNCAGEAAPTRAWLLGIATNLARNARRSRARALRRAEGKKAAVSDVDEQTPEARLAAEQAAAALFAAMASLSPEQSEAFGLRVIEGLTLEECGEVLGLPVSTVSYRARQAEERLRRALEDRS